MVNTNAVNSQTTVPKLLSFLGGAGPELLIGAISLFNSFKGNSAVNMSEYSLFGSNRSYGMDSNYSSYNRNYDYAPQTQSGSKSFWGTALKAFGITMLANMLLGKSAPAVKTAESLSQSDILKNLAPDNKYLKLSNWISSNLSGTKEKNLDIVSPKYREIMDAYNAGGKKDAAKLAEAKEIYKTGIITMAKDSIAPYDTDKDGALNVKEFIQKNITEAKQEAELAGEKFDAKMATDAAQIAFQRLSKDGKTVTEKDLSTIYAFADSLSDGNNGITKGNINFDKLCSVFGELIQGDNYKNSKGETIKNNIGEKLQGAYEFFFKEKS